MVKVKLIVRLKLIVKLISFIYFMIYLALINQANATSVFVNSAKSSIEMGKMLFITLKYEGKQIPESSNLQAWDKDFFVVKGDIETEEFLTETGQSLKRTTESLRLYPRSTGVKVLDAIALSGAISKPIDIIVLPIIRNSFAYKSNSSQRKQTKINGTPQWDKLPNEVWQGQSIKISVRLPLLRASNVVSVEKLVIPNFDVTSLGQEKIDNTIILSWLITANQAGQFNLELPKIQQRGRARWTFYLAKQSLRVKPLPSYLPVTTPVGKISLAANLIEKKGQYYGILELSNSGVLADDIYALRQQLAKNLAVPIDSIVKEELLKPDLLIKGMTIVSYQFPIKPFPFRFWKLGFTRSSPISVSYFDVKQGSLKHASVQFPKVIIISKTIKVFIVMLLWGLIGFVIWKLYRWVKTYLDWKKHQQSIANIPSAFLLKQFLLISHSESLNINNRSLTMTDWLNQMALGKEEIRLQHALEIKEQLNQLCFAPSSHLKLSQLKQKVMFFYNYKFYLSINS